VATTPEMTPLDDDALLVMDEVAKMLRLTRRTVQELVKHPTHPLPSMKMPPGSNRVRFRRRAVLAWIARQENGGKPDA
jgi:excisionase family DNA binding protein